MVSKGRTVRWAAILLLALLAVSILPLAAQAAAAPSGYQVRTVYYAPAGYYPYFFRYIVSRPAPAPVPQPQPQP